MIKLGDMDMLPLPSGDELEGNKAVAAASDLEPLDKELKT